MSTPPEQPSPNPYQQPPAPGQAPGPIPPQPPVGGYGTPVPAQHNPYAQPGPYGEPGAGQPGAGQQPPTQGYYMQPGMPGMPGAPRASGGAGRAVLWAVVGAAVASALWGGGVLLLDKDSTAKADLRGYTVKSNLCDSEDVSAFTTRYPQKDDDPTSYTTKTDTVDEMYCDQSLKQESSSLSDAYLYVDVTLHHKTDPTAEFADTYRSYTQRHQDYKVSPVAGIGQEAYLMTEDESSSEYVTLAVRDGWMTYTMSWSSYSVGTSGDDDTTTIDEAATMVKSATRATLPKLK